MFKKKTAASPKSAFLWVGLKPSPNGRIMIE
jgi:hypothetical protein